MDCPKCVRSLFSYVQMSESAHIISLYKFGSFFLYVLIILYIVLGFMQLEFFFRRSIFNPQYIRTFDECICICACSLHIRIYIVEKRDKYTFRNSAEACCGACFILLVWFFLITMASNQNRVLLCAFLNAQMHTLTEIYTHLYDCKPYCIHCVHLARWIHFST